jgi:hypothetical protein
LVAQLVFQGQSASKYRALIKSGLRLCVAGTEDHHLAHTANLKGTVHRHQEVALWLQGQLLSGTSGVSLSCPPGDRFIEVNLLSADLARHQTR